MRAAEREIAAARISLGRLASRHPEGGNFVTLTGAQRRRAEQSYRAVLAAYAVPEEEPTHA